MHPMEKGPKTEFNFYGCVVKPLVLDPASNKQGSNSACDGCPFATTHKNDGLKPHIEPKTVWQHNPQGQSAKNGVCLASITGVRQILGKPYMMKILEIHLQRYEGKRGSKLQPNECPLKNDLRGKLSDADFLGRSSFNETKVRADLAERARLLEFPLPPQE